MGDGDGAEMAEMMGGQPEAFLATIYNGSSTCVGCGCMISPVSAMYGGDRCIDCNSTYKSAKRKNRMA